MSDILFSSETVVVDLNIVSQKQLFQDMAARLISAHELDILPRGVDGRPVELVAFLLAPADAAGAHLRALARVSRLLRREENRERLRSAPDAQSVFTILSDDTLKRAAA